jgi:hypothetical protein
MGRSGIMKRLQHIHEANSKIGNSNARFNNLGRIGSLESIYFGAV